MSRTGILAGLSMGKLALWSGNAARCGTAAGRALGPRRNCSTIRYRGANAQARDTPGPQDSRHVGQPLQARLAADFVGPALASPDNQEPSGPAGRMRSDARTRRRKLPREKPTIPASRTHGMLEGWIAQSVIQAPKSRVGWHVPSDDARCRRLTRRLSSPISGAPLKTALDHGVELLNLEERTKQLRTVFSSAGDWLIALLLHSWSSCENVDLVRGKPWRQNHRWAAR